MATKINTGLNSGLMKFTFTDTDGDVIASFRLNPTDVRLAKRCEETQAYFRELSQKPQDGDADGLYRFNAELEEKICTMLGYNARETLFCELSATTVLPDGDIFAVKVLETVAQAVEPEVKKRAAAMEKAVAKYTEKYES
ncbi:MAG: hypothetical protein IJY28_01515 [Clostridia bacterium]|nr:hypothetical protein [Clostridia bacterium]